MIDHREVVASKLWKNLLSLRPESTEEDSYNYLILFLSGCVYLAQRRSDFSPMISDSSINDIAHLVHVADNRDPSSIGLWHDIERNLHKELMPLRGSPGIEFRGHALSDILYAFSQALYADLDALFIFETAYRRYVNYRNPLDMRIDRKVAELASCFLSSSVNVLDFFIFSGDLAVLGRQRKGSSSEVYANLLPSNEFPLRFRLALYGIRLMERTTRPPMFESSFALINYPSQRTTSAASLANQSRHADKSALEALDRLVQQNALAQLTMVVVPGTDRQAPGRRRELREYLSGEKLLAVVDLPFSPKAVKTKKSVSIWLISRVDRAQGNVLFVDAGKLLKSEAKLASEDSMRFIARLVRLWIAGGCVSTDDELSTSNQFDGLFRHEFRDGYKDVPGLCKSVNREEMELNNWSLLAATYLSKDARPGQNLATLDSHPILDLIAANEASPKRIYVIGNNGEGKSLLLGELVDHLAKNYVNTVGISFGLTDRFPFKRKVGQTRSTFTYQGARTSENGIQVLQTNRIIVRH